MAIDLLIGAIKAIVILLLVLNLSAVLLWFERKGSALIQDRVGANRAAIFGIGVYGVALGGWASNNRWSLLGGVRATAQMISYEIAMGLAIISIVITFGTLDLQDIVRQQGGVWFGWLPRWGIFLQPVAFLMLITAGMAESKRVPFDLPEGEAELIAGYFTDVCCGQPP